MRKRDIIVNGNRFGRWTIICEVEPIKTLNGSSVRRCLCKCDCGKERVVIWNYLKTGRSRSCGCYQRDITSKKLSKYSDNLYNSRLYRIWGGIKQRCYDNNSHNYKKYGEKGIIMCSEWKDDFLAFYNWSMSNGYSDDLTIDRIDYDGNYEPSNCRWATYKQQANNTRQNLLLTLNNETHTCAEWSDILGISKAAIQQRKQKLGWSDEKCLTTPLQKQHRLFNKEEVLSIRQKRKEGVSCITLSNEYGVNPTVIFDIIRGTTYKQY